MTIPAKLFRISTTTIFTIMNAYTKYGQGITGVEQWMNLKSNDRDLRTLSAILSEQYKTIASKVIPETKARMGKEWCQGH